MYSSCCMYSTYVLYVQYVCIRGCEFSEGYIVYGQHACVAEHAAQLYPIN